MTTRAKTLAKLAQLTKRLYDAKTSREDRRDLSLEVSILRSRIMRTRDPLGAMTRASKNDEEC